MLNKQRLLSLRQTKAQSESSCQEWFMVGSWKNGKDWLNVKLVSQRMAKMRPNFELECLPVGAAKVFLSAGVHSVPDHAGDVVRQRVAAAGA